MITIENLSKSFKLYTAPSDRLKELIWRRDYHKKFQALATLDLHVAAGETLGIIGRNGAGKSTLLKLLTGVLLPDSGTIKINGKITGLLELGTGFNFEFSGYDNIFLNGTYLGLSHQQILTRVDEIIAFSELAGFINEPLKTYSSGMVMRLAFATAIHADPQVFVVDEALSVGDAYFQHKCINRIKEFKEAGGAIVFVSHDMNAVKILCDRALLLENGKLIEEGSPEAIINSYNYLIARMSQGEGLQLIKDDSQMAFGNQQVRIEEVYLKLDTETEAEIFISGAPAIFSIQLVSEVDIDNLTLGLLIRDKFGQDIFGTNTFHLDYPLQLKTQEMRTINFSFDALSLGPGKYSITVALHTLDTHLDTCYHWVDKVKSFEIVHSAEYIFSGLCRMHPQIS